MIVFKLVVEYKTIVSVTEMFSKMASKLCQKWLTNFCQKAQNLVGFRPYDFVQILPACGPNTYQIMYGKTLDFQSISNGNLNAGSENHFLQQI